MDLESRHQAQLVDELEGLRSQRMRVTVPAMQQTPSPWYFEHMAKLTAALEAQR